MRYKEINKLIDKYRTCTDCELYKNTNNILIGHGNLDPIGLIIVPARRGVDNQYSTIYDFKSEEDLMLKKIFKKFILNWDDWFITSTIGCMGYPQKLHVDACRSRIDKLVDILAPKIIVLCGKPAYYSFYNNMPPKKDVFISALDEVKDIEWAPITRGIQRTKIPGCTIMYTYDFTDYIQAKKDNKLGYKEVANEIAAHWELISKCVETIKK